MAMLGLFDGPTGDPTSTPGSVDYRRRLAMQLGQQATDSSPKGHWTHILAQALQGGVSGYQEGKAAADEAAGRKSMTDAFAAAGPGGTPPMSALMNPWAPAGMAGAAFTHQLGAGDRAADRKIREQEMKLRVAADERSGTLQQWQIAQLIKSLQAPNEMDSTLGALGVTPPTRPPVLMPPIPPGLTPGGMPGGAPTPSGPPMPTGGAPVPSALRPAISPAAGAMPVPPMVPRFDEPASSSSYAAPTGVPGTFAGPPPSGMGAAPSTPPASPMARTDGDWSGRSGVIGALVASGRIKPEAANILARGPAFAGMPSGSLTEHDKRIWAAHDAAGMHETMVANIDQLKDLAPQAFVGANAETRAAIANQLSTLGIDSDWLLKRQSLPATQLLVQGLKQFVAIDAPKYKPLSNSDVQFIQSTYPNMSNDPVAMANGLEAMRKIALRQQLFETAKAEMLQTTPYPDINALRARVREQVPDHRFDPTLGKPPAAGPGAAGAAPPMPTGRMVWTPEGGLAPAPEAPPAPPRRPVESETPSWGRYR